jgi:LuxR family maltose regulon positive regulatory protein
MLATAATAATGDAVASMRWKAVLDRHRDSIDFHAGVAHVVDALVCQTGVDDMLAGLRAAEENLGADSEWFANAVTVEGVAMSWRGEESAAVERLRLGAELGERFGSVVAATYAHAALADLAARTQEYQDARIHASRAMALVDDHGLDYHFVSVLAIVMHARCLLVGGDPRSAQRMLHRAYAARTTLCEAMPGFAVHALLAMAETAAAVADVGGARQVLREAHGFLHGQSLGILHDRCDRVETMLSSMSSGTPHHQALTTAELRLLPYLRTHLSFPEIGERLYVSRHTVKTQAMSIYRKLGASTRSEAVASAEELGLLDASYP